MVSLKNTTALIACLAMSLPGAVTAQANANANAKQLAKEMARESGLKVCKEKAENIVVPCVTEDAFVLIEAETAGLPICEAETPVPCATEEGYVKVLGDSELALQAIANLQAPLDAASEPAAGSTPAEGSAPAEVADSTAQAAPAEGQAQLTEENPVVEGTTAEAETAPVEPKEGEGVSTISEDTTAKTETPPETTAEAETVVEADATAGSDTSAEAGAPAEADVTAEAGTMPEGGDVIVVEEAPVAAAAAAAETGDATATADVEVETEEVTEETSRSSSEDFETKVNEEATVTSEAKSGDDDGLSNFEKALLIGLGAVAVGSILNNGDEVVSNSGDRVVLRDNDGELRVLKNDDALLRQPGSEVRTETFNDGSTRTVVTREDGTQIVTIRAADGRVVRRARVLPDGRQIVLIDDTEEAAPVRVSELPAPEDRYIDVDVTDENALRLALAEAEQDRLERRYSLRQIRQIEQVRALAPQIELDAITFATGSAAIQPSQAEELAALGRAMARTIEERPYEVFLIEGHTDAVGDASYNLALSDRRAETVALALTEYFDVPPENMVTQGYGESQLKIQTLGDERANRRATVRRITPLLGMASN